MVRGARVAAAVLTAMLVAGGRASANPAPAAATAAPAAAPAPSSLGVPYVPRTGFFLEGQVGVFTAFGGQVSASNGDLFTALQLGYDFPGLNVRGNGVRRVSLFLTAGFGENDNDCHIVEGGQCVTWNVSGNTAPLASPNDFLLIPVEIGTRIGFGDMGLENLFSYLTFGAGGAFALPALAQSGGAMGFNFSAGLGIEYDTPLPGLNFGIEAVFQGALIKWSAGSASGSLFLPYLTAYPRFEYVF